MSTQYPGGFITKSPVAPTSTAASGIWTVDQALQYVKAGTWPQQPIYIEDVFSTYLYTGTGATLTITNGIDLSTKGGLWWGKGRSNPGNLGGHGLVDTVRGKGSMLQSNTTAAPFTTAGNEFVTSFNTNGVTIGNDNTFNRSGELTVGWTFAKQSKFFDVVTYTGTGASVNISHALGTTPGFLIIKKTSGTGNWPVFARDGTVSGKYTYSYFNSGNALNLTSGAASVNAPGENDGYITSTTFNPNSLSGSASVGNVNNINDSGATYIAYLFAHNAGGFPANGTGSTNGISCGSFTADGSGNATINLGYEPQWILLKRNDGLQAWVLSDNMRGLLASGSGVYLSPNSSGAEGSLGWPNITATGFTVTTLGSGSVYIYMAIRRGPMKTPTVGTSVFGINARTGTGVDVTVTGGQTDDVAVIKARSTGQAALWAARLTGTGYAQSDATSAIAAAGTTILQANPWDVMDGVKVGTTSAITNASAATYINYLAKRAPGFMDVVCYEGIDPSIEHNLGVTPEMYIVKSRSATGATGGRWSVYHTGYATATNFIALNSTNGITAGTIWGSGPTASVIGATGNTPVNDTGQTYIAYLFATLAGISKVGSYTGTGALQTVNCGFTAGARFILIKRTDSTGEWYTYDSTRGLSSGTDPYFLMNSSAAETTGTNYVDTDTTGFKVTAAAPADLNAVGGNYIFLAIA